MAVMRKAEWLMALLCALRFADPLAFTHIFPYLNTLLARLRLVRDPANIGFYTGLVESTFAFFQLCSIYQWARLSDVLGRRPVVVATTFGLGLATLLFGLADTLPLILFSRALAGICSGNAAVLHSILGELATPATEALAFSTYGLFWPLGAIIGPILGGALADPATAYPRIPVFQRPFFIAYPYFLPSFVAALLVCLIAALAMAFLRETLPTKRALPMSDSMTPLLTAAPEVPRSNAPPPITLTALLRNPVLNRLALSGALLCFTATAFDAVFVLFCYTPVHLGGLSFDASQIATALALAGTSSILLQITALPPLLRRAPHAKLLTHARLYSLSMLAWPLAYAALPVLNRVVVRGGVGGVEGYEQGLGLGQRQQVPLTRTLSHTHTRDDDRTGGWGQAPPRLSASAAYLLWAGIVAVMVLSRVGCLAYSISLVLVKQNAPSPAALGKANGLVLWAMCFARAGAPAFASSAFAWSTTHRAALGGSAAHAWLAVMLVVAGAGCIVSRTIERAVGGKGLVSALGEEGEVRGVEWEGAEAAGERVAYVAEVAAWRAREGACEDTQARPQTSLDNDAHEGHGGERNLNDIALPDIFEH